MEKVCEKYKIRKKNDLYSLDDILDNIVKTKNKYIYIKKTKDKEKIDDKYYVSKDKFELMLKNSRSIGMREAFKTLLKDTNNENNDEDSKDNEHTEFFDCIQSYDGYKIHIIVANNEYWFRGKDVCEMLEYSKERDALTNNVDKDNKILLKTLVRKDAISNGVLAQDKVLKIKNAQPTTIYINYSGLYELCLLSKKPKAKEFRKWITNEVIPSIEKTGTYTLPNNSIVPLPAPTKMEVDLNDHIGARCLYVIHLKNNLYKFGITKRAIGRMNEHLKNYDYEKIIKVYQMKTIDDCMEIEDKFRQYCKQNKIDCKGKRQKEILGHKSTTDAREMFETSNDFSIEIILGKISYYIDDLKHRQEIENNPYDGIKDINIIKVLSEERIKTKQLEKDVKIRELELKYELEKLKLQKDIEVKNQEQQNPVKINTTNQVKISDFLISSVKETNKKVSVPDKESGDDSENKPKKVNIKINKSNKKKCKECNKNIHKDAIHCSDCDHKNRFYDNLGKSDRPSYMTLKKEIKESSYVAVGKKYGVSDNAVRKWLRKYERFGETDT